MADAEEVVGAVHHDSAKDRTPIPHEAPHGVCGKVVLGGHVFVYVLGRQPIDGAIPYIATGRQSSLDHKS